MTFQLQPISASSRAVKGQTFLLNEGSALNRRILWLTGWCEMYTEWTLFQPISSIGFTTSIWASSHIALLLCVTTNENNCSMGKINTRIWRDSLQLAHIWHFYWINVLRGCPMSKRPLITSAPTEWCCMYSILCECTMPNPDYIISIHL